MSLGVQDDLLAGLQERLLSQGTAEELRDGARDLMARSAEPGIFGVPRFSKRCRRRFPHYSPSPGLRFGIGLYRLLELEEERWVLIPGEKPKQDSVCQLEGTSCPGPLQLQQTPVLGDRPNVFDPLGYRGRKPEEVPAPDSGVLLLLDYGQRRLRFGDRQVGCLDDLRRGVALRGQLAIRAVSDGGAAVFQQPGERDPVLRRKFQNRSRRDGWQAEAAAKILEGWKGRKVRRREVTRR